MIKRFQAKRGFVLPLLTDKIYEFTDGFNVLFGANGCLAENTLVATPNGPTPIQSLKIGDTVFDESGDPIKVINVIDNGEKEVVELVSRNKVVAECTMNHVWLAKETRSKKFKEIRTEDFPKSVGIKRTFYKTRGGEKEEPNAYSIAALIGDGFPVNRINQIMIANRDEMVVKKVAACLGNKSYKKVDVPYDLWEIDAEHFDLYIDWYRGRNGKDKIVDINTVKTWTSNSMLWFLAGLIDSNGSVFVETNKPTTINLTFSTQSRNVIEGVQYILNYLYGLDTTVFEDTRYSNGIDGIYYLLKLTDHYTNVKILSEIGDRIQIVKKRLSSFNLPQRKKADVGYTSVHFGNKRIAHVWDITVDSPTNLYCLANGLVTHNSGKSSMLKCLKGYMGIPTNGWSKINDPSSHAASMQSHFPFVYNAYTPANCVCAIERSNSPAFYFHGDVKLDMKDFYYDDKKDASLTGMETLELAAKHPSSGQFKIEMINRIMNTLQTPPNLSFVPEYISNKHIAQMEVEYLKSLPTDNKMTLIFDEIEQNLSLPFQSKLMDVMETLSKSFQVIWASHSFLPLFRNDVNLIEVTPGYAEECRNIYKTAVKKYKGK